MAPEGAVVRLVAIAAETRELMASKRRMMEISKKRILKITDRSNWALSEDILVKCNEVERAVFKAETRMPKGLIIPAM
jgi:hypothetical protein